MNDLFYHGTSFQLGNPVYVTYMCQGQRGRGKTTYWLAEAAQYPIKDWIENHETNRKFIFIRRSEEQLKLVMKQGLFKGVLSVPKYRENSTGIQFLLSQKIVFIYSMKKTKKTLCI